MYKRQVTYFRENQIAYPYRRAAAVAASAAPAAVSASAAPAAKRPRAAAAAAGSAASAGALATTAGGGAGSDDGDGGAQLATSHGSEAAEDFAFGWAQIVSALVSHVVAFNSLYNLHSFVMGAPRHMRVVPDRALRGGDDLAARLWSRAVVLYFPVERPLARGDAGPGAAALATGGDCEPPASLAPPAPLVIAWNHRWEYDKDPDALFAALAVLRDRGVPFRVVVCGECAAGVAEAGAPAWSSRAVAPRRRKLRRGAASV